MDATAQAFLLMPGDVVLGSAGDQFRTLLGSCVCIILTDPRRTVAAVCHIVHAGRAPTTDPTNTAYGEAAMARMDQLLATRGIRLPLCQAYVYGGGNMFPHLVGREHVGMRNARWALQRLHHDGVSVLECSLGEAVYRKVSWTLGPDQPEVHMVPMPLPVGDSDVD